MTGNTPGPTTRTSSPPWARTRSRICARGYSRTTARATKKSPSYSDSREEKETSMPKVKIPTPLRQYTNGSSEVEVGGGTAGETLGNLAAEYPDLRQHLYTGDGKLRSFVNVD